MPSLYSPTRIPRCEFSRILARLGLAVMIAGTAAACRPGKIDMQAMLKAPLPGSEQGLQDEAQRLGVQYDKKPGEKIVSMRYAQVLRQLGQTNQAVAVLQRATLVNLGDTEVSAAYGKALADGGRLKEASEVLALAHTPDRPNWKLLSVQGSVADQMGDHGRAQELYISALKIAPGEPAVLSNLGLSYALSRRVVDAERVLSQAAAHPRADDRVRANLAMVRDLARKGGAGGGNASGNSSGNSWADIRKAEAQTKGAASRTRSASPRD